MAGRRRRSSSASNTISNSRRCCSSADAVASKRNSFPSRDARLETAFPAKVGIHSSRDGEVEGWVPAFAGTADDCARKAMTETLRPRVLVVGGGMGGYVAAVRASQLGLAAVLVAKDRLGAGAAPRIAVRRQGDLLDRGIVVARAAAAAGGDRRRLYRARTRHRLPQTRRSGDGHRGG